MELTRSVPPSPSLLSEERHRARGTWSPARGRLTTNVTANITTTTTSTATAGSKWTRSSVARHRQIVHANRASRITAMPDGAKDVGQSGAGCRSSLQMQVFADLGATFLFRFATPLRTVPRRTTVSPILGGCPETVRVLQGASELRTKRSSSVPRTHACTHAHFARRRRSPRFFAAFARPVEGESMNVARRLAPLIFFSLSLSLSLSLSCSLSF